MWFTDNEKLDIGNLQIVLQKPKDYGLNNRNKTKRIHQ